MPWDKCSPCNWFETGKTCFFQRNEPQPFVTSGHSKTMKIAISGGGRGKKKTGYMWALQIDLTSTYWVKPDFLLRLEERGLGTLSSAKVLPPYPGQITAPHLARQWSLVPTLSKQPRDVRGWSPSSPRSVPVTSIMINKDKDRRRAQVKTASLGSMRVENKLLQETSGYMWIMALADE